MSSTFRVDLDKAYSLCPDSAVYVSGMVAGLLGLPVQAHLHSFNHMEINLKQFIASKSESPYMTWTDSEGDTSVLYREGDLFYFLATDSSRLTFWYKSLDQLPVVTHIIQEVQKFTYPEEVIEAEKISRISLLLSNPMTGELNEIRRTMYDWQPKSDEELALLYDFSKFKELGEFITVGEGLAVMVGPPGTGKTSIIRDITAYLTEEDSPVEIVYLTSENLSALGSEQFVSYFIRNNSRTLVCEDAEPVLQRNADGRREAATSNLLNLTSGVLGDIAKTKVIATLNCDLGVVDEALLRPGRCKLIWEVNPYTEEQALKYWEYKYENDEDSVILQPTPGFGKVTIAELQEMMFRVK